MAHEVSWTSASVVFEEQDGVHGNFTPAAWKRIQANPMWQKRLAKAYTASRFIPRANDRRRAELDCATSSDALLMNIFCYPRVLHRPRFCAMLDIEAGLEPEFGFRPAIPLGHGKSARTEIDMRLGNLLVEAKLTESDFQRAPERLFHRYREVDEVFDTERLPIAGGQVQSWQLIRGVLAAHAQGCSFRVLCDRRRPDLIDLWFEVIRAVADASLRTRLGILTWQELSTELPETLQLFLEEKYGIVG